MKKFLSNLGSTIASPFVNLAKSIKNAGIKIASDCKTAWIYLTNKEERAKINAKLRNS